MIDKPTVRIVSQPKPSIKIYQEDDEVDLTQSAISVTCHIDGRDDYVTIVTYADVVTDFPMNVTVKPQGTNVLDGLTADELNGIIAMAGMSTSAGQAVLEHLQQRAAGVQ